MNDEYQFERRTNGPLVAVVGARYWGLNHVRNFDELGVLGAVCDGTAEPLRRQCLEFLDCIKTRRRPLTDGESGLRVLRVLDAAERSLACGGAPISL